MYAKISFLSFTILYNENGENLNSILGYWIGWDNNILLIGVSLTVSIKWLR